MNKVKKTARETVYSTDLAKKDAGNWERIETSKLKWITNIK